MSLSTSSSDAGASPGRYLATFAATMAAAFLASIAVVFVVDPLQAYRQALLYEPLITTDERLQNAGLLRNYPAPNVIIGSSITQACRSDRFEALLGEPVLRVSAAAMSAREQALAIETRLAEQPTRRFFDFFYWYTFARPTAETLSSNRGEFPLYLYRFNLADQLKYLLNIDNIGLSIALIRERYLSGPRLERAPFIGRNSPEIDPKRRLGLPGMAKLYREIVKTPPPTPTNLAVERERFNRAFAEHYDAVIRRHPDVEFDVVLPPFSLLYYQAFGAHSPDRLELILSARTKLIELKSQVANLRLHDFSTQTAWITDSSLYYDTHHFGAELCGRIAERIASNPEGDSVDEVAANDAVLRRLIAETPLPFDP